MATVSGTGVRRRTATERERRRRVGVLVVGELTGVDLSGLVAVGVRDAQLQHGRPDRRVLSHLRSHLRSRLRRRCADQRHLRRVVVLLTRTNSHDSLFSQQRVYRNYRNRRCTNCVRIKNGRTASEESVLRLIRGKCMLIKLSLNMPSQKV